MWSTGNKDTKAYVIKVYFMYTVISQIYLLPQYELWICKFCYLLNGMMRNRRKFSHSGDFDDNSSTYGRNTEPM